MIEATRFDDANAMMRRSISAWRAMRLQGQGMTELQDYWIGFSTFLPGGGAEKAAAPTGKVYIVLDGKITGPPLVAIRL